MKERNEGKLWNKERGGKRETDTSPTDSEVLNQIERNRSNKQLQERGQGS